MADDDDVDSIDTIRRKLSFLSSLDSKTSPSLETPLTINDDALPIPFSTRQIYKNLLVISFVLLLLMTSYTNIVMLQSSLNTDGNVGVNSLVITYVVTIVSAIFLATPTLDVLGLKWSVLLGEIVYVLYILANVRPLPSFMYITAALVGVGSAPLWTAQALYLNRLGRYHASHKRQSAEASVSLFFGLFIMLQGTSAIWGNLISYFVIAESGGSVSGQCGIHFDPLANFSGNRTERVDETTRYVLCGIFVAMGVLSMIVLCLTLDQIRLVRRQSIRASLKRSAEVLLSMVQCRHVEQIFLIPITMWVMIETAFLAAQFTRAFITCLIGIRYVGLVLVAHGICHVIGGYVFGWLAKYIGRLGCFIIGAVLNYAMLAVMYLWQPNVDQSFVLFVIASVWGVADAIWQSQVVATYTILYSESDPTAVPKYRLWKSAGSVITYAYSSYVTIRVSMIILLAFLTVSMISYGVVEVRLRRRASYTPVD